MKAYLLLLFTIILGYPMRAQEETPYRIAFYNLENLFDTIADSSINDLEYTPQGNRYWTSFRYREKINHMAKAIRAIGGWEPPMVVGVAEVENRGVLNDLVHSPALLKSDYQIIHRDSPDGRGIDVGLLYRRGFYFPLQSRFIPITMPEDPDFDTRDVIYSKGRTHDNDTLHIFVCHWPSRYGGQQQSEPKRIRAAEVVRATVDSIWQADSSARILIMGDFNDEWDNISLSEVLMAQPQPDSGNSPQLINLMAGMPENEGSHRYHGEWSYLDQIIISRSLWQDPAVVPYSGAGVCREAFLLERDERYPGEMPFRTFLGMRYNGGFSDHLPVYFDLPPTSAP